MRNLRERPGVLHRTVQVLALPVVRHERRLPEVVFSFPESSGPGSPRRKQPELRQHFLNSLADPHGQRSFLPTFSSSSLTPWTTRTPRFTPVSDGKPLRRLLIGSKQRPVAEVLRVHVAPPFPVK